MKVDIIKHDEDSLNHINPPFNSTIIIKHDEDSLNHLNQLFNSTMNPVFCAVYGGGTHCDNPERSEAKARTWGDRATDEAVIHKECALARIILENESKIPLAMLNIGYTGNPITVKATKNAKSGIHEIGLFISDQVFENGNESIRNGVFSQLKSILTTCHAETGYETAIGTFAHDHPYLQDIAKNFGADLVNESNVKSLLGSNSLHPERFSFKDNKFHECTEWHKTDATTHEGWDSKNLCTSWTQKEMIVLSDNSFAAHQEL
jgi:hypothetical protein